MKTLFVLLNVNSLGEILEIGDCSLLTEQSSSYIATEFLFHPSNRNWLPDWFSQTASMIMLSVLLMLRSHQRNRNLCESFDLDADQNLVLFDPV